MKSIFEFLHDLWNGWPFDDIISKTGARMKTPEELQKEANEKIRLGLLPPDAEIAICTTKNCPHFTHEVKPMSDMNEAKAREILSKWEERDGQPTTFSFADVGRAEGYLLRCSQEKAIFGPILEALKNPFEEGGCYQVCIGCGKLSKALESYRRQEGL